MKNLDAEILTIGEEVFNLISDRESERANKLESVRHKLTDLNVEISQQQEYDKISIESYRKIANKNGIELSDAMSVYILAEELIEALLAKIDQRR